MEKDKSQKPSELIHAPREQLRQYGAKTLATVDPNSLKKDPEVVEAFGKDFPIADFVREGIHDKKTVLRDARYINTRRFEYGEEPYRARTLETVVRRGIVENGWLGDEFSGATVFQTTKYDDYQNRCDFVVSAEDLSFAVDVTYNSTKIRDKLNRPTNDDALSAELPPGFGRVKYFDDGEIIDDRQLPRFVIGLDYFDNEAILKQAPNSEANNRVRFKILSELLAQAKRHYGAMLETDPGVENDSTIAMENLYYTFDESLRSFLDELLLPDKNGQYARWQERVIGADKFENRLKLIEEQLYSGDGVYKDTMRVLEIPGKALSVV